MKSVTGYKNRYKLPGGFVPCMTNRQQQIFRQGRTAGKIGIPYAELACGILGHAFIASMTGWRHMAYRMRNHAALRKQEGKNQQKGMQDAFHAGHSNGSPVFLKHSVNRKFSVIVTSRLTRIIIGIPTSTTK